MSAKNSTVHLGPAKAVQSKRGARAIVQSVWSKSAILALQACTGVLTARELGPNGRGELAAMILWPLLVANVTTFGLPSALIYHFRNGSEDRRRLAGNGLLASFVIGAVAAGVAAIVLPFWLHKYSQNVIHFAQLFLLTVPICSVTLAGRAILEADHQFSASNLVQLFTPLSTLAFLVLFLAMHMLDPFTAALAYITASLPSLGYMLFCEARLGYTWARPQFRVVRQMLQYGVRSYGIDILGTLSLQVDQVLVVALLSAEAMGSYVVVLSVSRMLNVFQNSAVMILFPKAAGREPEEVLALTGKCVRLSGLVSALAGCLICVMGHSLLRIVYGAAYDAATGTLYILVLEAVLSGVTFVLAQAFMALNRPGTITLVQAIGLSLSVPLMLWLIPSYGPYGAAISLLISTATRLLFVCAGFRFVLKQRRPRLIPSFSDVALLLDHWAIPLRENI